MIRVTILYPNEAGKKFDWDYYTKKHLPLLKQELTPLGMVRAEADKGISGPDPKAPPSFLGVAHLYFKDVDTVHSAFKQTGRKVMGDMANYTDIKPQIVINEILP